MSAGALVGLLDARSVARSLIECFTMASHFTVIGHLYLAVHCIHTSAVIIQLIKCR